MYQEIKNCRICNNSKLIPILNLGEQVLTGIFPRSKSEQIDIMPLELVKCSEDLDDQTSLSAGETTCGLVQLKHTGDLSQMYGDNYGYRSGLNPSMVRHLYDKVQKLSTRVHLEKNDLIIDIGSNDSTLLQAYPKEGYRLVGIDPTGSKFKSYYPQHIELLPDFFTEKTFTAAFGTQKAKVITSISMFYDLEAPMTFMKEVHSCLDDQGIWVLEQSYMPTMLKMNSYDTACHEHLEYYSLKSIQWMAKKVGFKIVDVEFNMVNGGSFSLTLSKSTSGRSENSAQIAKILKDEQDLELHTLKPYADFKKNIEEHKVELKKFLHDARAANKKVFGYGASTKGNVLLQYCDITETDLPYIAEVNENKFGCYTPGTRIPIISEADARKLKPDYFLVLPWHFKDGIIAKEKEFLASGGKLVFPLPKLTIV